jgi:hypothetical protein
MTSTLPSNHCEQIAWRARFRVEKYDADVDAYFERFGKEEGLERFLSEQKPREVDEREGNLLMTAGAQALWTALTGGTVSAFSNANATIGVGDTATASAASQTNLQATTNGFRQSMATSYPVVSGNQVQFQGIFGGSSANFAWNEWGVFNSAGTGTPPTGGTMLNRAVPSGGLGVKASGATWTLTVTLSLS